MAYRHHRSGQPDDFFPYCRRLAADDELSPTADDYERLMRERDRRFVETLPVEAAFALQEARDHDGEHRVSLGGKFGVLVAIETIPEIGLEQITLAFRVPTVPWSPLSLVLAAFEPSQWDDAARLPSRDLEKDEIAFTTVREVDGRP